MEQSLELREAHETAKAILDGLSAAKALQRQARTAAQSLAQFRDAPPSNPEPVRAVVRELRRNAYAAASRLGARTAKPQEAQHEHRRIA